MGESKQKKIVLISFCDRICLSTRLLSSVLKQSGHQVFLIFLKDDRARIIDEIDENAKFHQFIFNQSFHGCGLDVNPVTQAEMRLAVEKISEIRPDAVGISSRTVTLDISRKIIGKLRECLPHARFFGGGFGPSMTPEKFLEFLDFVCIGEGETVIHGLATDEDPQKLNNVAWMENGGLKQNPVSAPVDLNELPSPDWSVKNKFIIDDNQILPIEQSYDTKTYDIFATRGCPNTCTYCMASQLPFIYGDSGCTMPRVRARSPENVIAELEWAKKEYGIQYVRFKDSILGYNRKWLNRFLDLYDLKIGLPFNCYIEPQFNNRDSIERLCRSGLGNSTVGIQAVDPNVRELVMGRKVSDDALVDYAEMIAGCGIDIQYDILHWNPFDTVETLENGINFLKRFPKGEDTCVFQLKFFPKSKLFSIWSKEKPEPLGMDLYEYYAWIFQMVLYDENTEQLADTLHRYDYFRTHPRALREIFIQEISNIGSSAKIMARRDIRKGDIITNVMVKKARASEKNAVSWDNKNRVLSKKASRFIKKGSLIHNDAYFSSYETKH